MTPHELAKEMEKPRPVDGTYRLLEMTVYFAPHRQRREYIDPDMPTEQHEHYYIDVTPEHDELGAAYTLHGIYDDFTHHVLNDLARAVMVSIQGRGFDVEFVNVQPIGISDIEARPFVRAIRPYLKRKADKPLVKIECNPDAPKGG